MTEPTPFEEVPTVDEVGRLPEFNPLQTWDAMVAEFGDPTNPNLYEPETPPDEGDFYDDEEEN